MQGRTAGITIEGQAPPAPGQMPFADFRSVSPGYFETMRIPLLHGRDISWDDSSRAPLVVVVSKTMAEAFWPGSDAIGKHIAAIDPKLPVSRIRTMEQVESAYLGPQRFNLMLVAFFGALALILAAVGIYGVASYFVAQRQREIGVRMALGAGPSNVFRLVVGQGASLALLGAAAGVLGAWLVAKSVQSLLYDISVHDPATFLAATLLLVLVALAASYLPARRAMCVDPVAALRSE